MEIRHLVIKLNVMLQDTSWGSCNTRIVILSIHEFTLGNLFVIQSSIDTCHGDPLGGFLFTLVHFCTFHDSANHIPSCLFPSGVNDSHIIRCALVVFKVFHHFTSWLDLVGLVVHHYKCVAWIFFGATFNVYISIKFLHPYWAH